MQTPLKSMLVLVCALLSYTVGAANSISPRIDGNYSNPLPSPDLQYILMAGDAGAGLFLYSVGTGEVTQISDNIASGYGYSWDDNGQYFYFREKPEEANMSESLVMMYSMENGEVSENQYDLTSVDLPSFHGLDENGENQIIIYTDLDDLQIYSLDLITRDRKNITNDANSQFYAAVLSHDKSKIAVHRDADIMIFTLDGSQPPYVIGQGLATQWSADDRYVLGFQDYSEDGHEISGGEIFLYDTQTKKAQQITHTEDVAELYPSFYGKDQIIYSDPLNQTISTLSIKTQY